MNTLQELNRVKNYTKSDWHKEYKYIEDHIDHHVYTKKASLHSDKNRYSNILPYDDYCISLSDNNYINASWMTNQYIATQGPLKNTVSDFWQMIWETNCLNIIMLTQLSEKNVNKCYCYWPEDKLLLNEYKDKTDYIMLTSVTSLSKDIIMRQFMYHKNDEHRVITQYQYMSWPDFGCPNKYSFIKLINIVKPLPTPLCIHCSAGVGRTGVLITILMSLSNFNYNIVEIILQLRQYRIGMVQTKEQLEFCYKVISYINKNKTL